jgi:Ca2+-binding EF-hand superfamily protein
MRIARLGVSNCHCLSLLLLLHLLSSCATGQATDQRSHLRRLFESLDQDHDGQLHKQELRQYIGGLAPEYSDSRSKLDQAVEGAIDRLDSADIGLGVSRIELEQHLHTLLPVSARL